MSEQNQDLAEQLAQLQQQYLQRLQQDYPQLGDIRGRGLMLGAAATLGACSTSQTLAQTTGQPLAETAQGKVRGLVQPNGVTAFKGMRYASAARFMPPMAPPTIHSGSRRRSRQGQSECLTDG